MEAVRVLIVDDHLAVAEALRSTLAATTDLEVAAVAHTVRDAVTAARRERPDVVLLDYRLPDATGPDAIVALHAVDPDIRVVVLTGSGGDQALLSALDAGATGFITKRQPFSAVVTAIFDAAAGRSAIDPTLLGRVLPEIRRDESSRIRLTRRERDVLELMAAGRSNAEIADALFVSVNTVRNHAAHLFHKLGAATRGEATAIALAQGLVAPDGRDLHD